MSKISLYIDEDAMDEDFLRALRSRNVDVVTPKDVGMMHRSDEDQLAWAMENGRVIFTFNVRDFNQLHSIWIEKGWNHAGIIFAPQQRYGIGELIRGVLMIINSYSSEEIQNRAEFVSNWI
jgi:Domain of unknown function (DUF5615)